MLLAFTNLAQAQVDVDVLVRNQRFHADTFFFDIYLQKSGTDNLFLGNADFALDFEEAYFANPVLGLKQGSTQFENGHGLTTSFYDTNINTKIETKGVNAYKLMIYVQMPVYSNHTQFLDRIARIDGQNLTHRLGTFYVTNSIDASSNPSLSWRTNGDGLVLKVKHRDSASMAAQNANIDAVNPALESQPIMQAGGLVVDAKSGNSITLSWTAGNGTGRILLVNLGSTVPSNAFPVDGIQYLADSVFGYGDNPGNDSTFVVYAGNGNSVTVTGLNASSTYHFALFEYNGANGWSENYATSGPAVLSETTEGPFIAANIKVFLQGAFNTGTGMMTTALRMGNNFGTTNLLPAAQPYNSAPWNYSGAENVDTANHPTTAVDWVLVELRSTASGAAVNNGRAAGFLLADGSIVDTNGVDPIRFWNVTAGYYFVVIKHRNHLPVMTRDSILINSNSSLYSFTNQGQGQAYGNDTTTFHNMPMSSLGGGRYGMRGGDAGGNAPYQVRYNGGGLNDRFAMLIQVGAATNSTPINNQYSRTDVNLDRQIRYNGGGLNDRFRILIWVGAATNSTPINTQVPNP